MASVNAVDVAAAAVDVVLREASEVAHDDSEVLRRGLAVAKRLLTPNHIVRGLWAAVAAQRESTRLLTARSWAGIPPGAGFFFSSLSYQKCVLNHFPHGGASLLIFL